MSSYAYRHRCTVDEAKRFGAPEVVSAWTREPRGAWQGHGPFTSQAEAERAIGHTLTVEQCRCHTCEARS